MHAKIIRRLVVLFVVIAAILVVVAVVAVRNINRAVAGSDWVNQTHAVILELGEIRSAFHASDAAVRTLAVTGNEQDESVGREAVANLAEHVAVAKLMLVQQRDGVDQRQVLLVIAPRPRAVIKEGQAVGVGVHHREGS